MGLIVTTPPDSEPVVPEEVLAHLRLPADTTEDALLAGLVTAAREHLELITRRVFVTQVLQFTLDGFPLFSPPTSGPGRSPWSEIILPRSPVSAIISITYYDPTGASQILSPSVYQFDATRTPPRVVLAPNQVWPATQWRPDAVTIDMTAGYADAAAVPQGIKQAMLLLVGSWYENREATISGATIAEVPFAVDALIAPYRVIEFP